MCSIFKISKMIYKFSILTNTCSPVKISYLLIFINIVNILVNQYNILISNFNYVLIHLIVFKIIIQLIIKLISSVYINHCVHIIMDFNNIIGSIYYEVNINDS